MVYLWEEGIKIERREFILIFLIIFVLILILIGLLFGIIKIGAILSPI